MRSFIPEIPLGHKVHSAEARVIVRRLSRSKEFSSDTTGAQLIAVGHAAIARANGLILLGGVLGLAEHPRRAGPRRVGAPVLLVFLAIGVIGGEHSVFGIAFDAFPRST